MTTSEDPRQPIDEFLDLACLAYTGADRPERRVEAARLLGAHPEWVASDIHVAAALGAVDDVREILHHEPTAALRTGGPRDWEPLLYLAYARVSGNPAVDYPEAARLLLDHGANSNASFSLWGGSFTVLTGVLGEGEQGPENLPPHPAVERLVEILFRYGAQANDPQGAYNRMHREGDGWLHTLLDNGLRATHTINWDMGDSQRPRTLDFLLSHAVDSRFIRRIKLVLAHGANPNCRNPYNGRPVRTNALLSGSNDVADLLEDAGAEIIPFTVYEQFRLAIRNNDSAEARRLVAAEPACLADVTVLRDAARDGDVRTVEMLLDLGADVNASDPGGVTPLHKAAENGRIAVIQLLIEQGADPNLQDLHFDGTPRGWAEHAGQVEAVKTLDVLVT